MGVFTRISHRDFDPGHVKRNADTEMLKLRSSHFDLSLAMRDRRETFQADRIDRPISILSETELMAIEGEGRTLRGHRFFCHWQSFSDKSPRPRAVIRYQ
jgi:hypothetical protein